MQIADDDRLHLSIILQIIRMDISFVFGQKNVEYHSSFYYPNSIRQSWTEWEKQSNSNEWFSLKWSDY